MIHFDVETYSEADLNAVGVYRYCEHPSTRVLCASAAIDPHPTLRETMTRDIVWLPGDPPPEKVMTAVANGHTIVAHNCEFDSEVWRVILHRLHGWWWPGYSQWLDSMSVGMMCNLPGSLKIAAQLQGAGEQKDDAGHKLMMTMCKPAQAILADDNPLRLHTPENLRLLSDYCTQDVRAEQSLFHSLPTMPDCERETWHATWAMNRRGVRIDTALVATLRGLAGKVQERYRERLVTATDGVVQRETQYKRMAAYLTSQGYVLPKTAKGGESLGAKTAYLIDDTNATAQGAQARALYDKLNASSLAKLPKMAEMAMQDGRVRGANCYAGATQTGRWAGRGVQMQNLPKGILEGERAYLTALEIVNGGTSVAELEMLYGDSLDVITSLIRACIVAAPGHVLVCADYRAIEGRVAAWIAREQHILAAYRDGRDPYILAAKAVFGGTYDSIAAEVAAGSKGKRKVGKVSELACQYGGAVGAFLSMGGYTLGLSHDRMQEIVTAWRDDRLATVAAWAAFEQAAMRAIKNPGMQARCLCVNFFMSGNHLMMRLPSGRCLWYRDAKIGTKTWPDGRHSPQVMYRRGSKTAIWWESTYGAKLFENATQAVARDLLAHATVQAERDQWRTSLTVHDELVAEEPIGGRTHEDLCALMRETPAWAEGIPIDAAGWTGTFYRKD